MAVREFSYGIVPLRNFRGEWQVLLVQHGRAKHWGFPKGHAELGETSKEAATRELFEETNLTVIRFFSDSTFEEHYDYTLNGQLINKTAYFYIAEVEGILQLQAEEISDSRWLSIEKALLHLTFETDKSICRQAASFL